ncbi:MAG: hypothetical protein CMO82_04805 [Winogradskyella sp.]|nr:hypothetical protein [Winogradskyella sp.]|tara:strand:- start:502 stop:1278 length:777 start_codon:yes stop_codon:yes gene_type:complete
MRHKKIKRVFARIKKGRQLVGIEVENHNYTIFLSGSNVKQNTGLNINEIEMLEGSLIRPDFYKKGEKMFNEKICEKDNLLIRDFWITLVPNNIEKFKAINQTKKIDFKQIKQVFTFTRNGRVNCGIKTLDDEVVFVTKKRLEGLTSLDESEFHILENSYINPIYYKNGEIMAGGKKCYSDNSIIKELNLRFSGNVEQMHQNFEENEPNFYYSHSNNSNYSSNSYAEYGGPSDGYGGHIDDDFINDVLGGHPDAYWNID